MRFLRWIVIFLSFSLELRLKAVEQEPLKCLASKQSCSIFSRKPETLVLKKFQLSLSSGAVLFRDSGNEWNLVSGTVRIQNKAVVQLNTKVGLIYFAPGTHWAQWRDEKLWVYEIEGDSEIALKSSNQERSFLSEGFYNWYSLVNYRGFNPQGVPRRITLSEAKSFLPRLNAFKDFSLVERAESRFLALASDFYHDVAQDIVDTGYAEEQKARIEEYNRRQFDLNLRQTFRNKYLGPVDLEEDSEEIKN